MNDKNLSDLGRELGETVQNAVMTGDYSQIKNTVSQTMETVVNQTISFGKQIGNDVTHAVNDSRSVYQSKPAPGQTGASPFPYHHPMDQKQPQTFVKVGKATSIVKQLLGAWITGLSILAAIMIGIILLLGINLSGGLTAFLILGVCTAGGLTLMISGIKSVGLTMRYKRYCQMLLPKSYSTVAELAGSVHKSSAFAIRDIEKMLQKGWFPQGHFDQQKTALMIGEQVYNQYLDTLKSKQQREAIAQNPEGIEAVTAEGRACVRRIKAANEALPGQDISDKLSRLETVIVKIFSYVEQRPAKLPEIRRFMNYYLPTTIKLVDSYCEFEHQPVQVNSIIAAKQEISETLTTINEAFETLLDSLYQDDAIDVSTDISALKTILTQEGLVETERN